MGDLEIKIKQLSNQLDGDRNKILITHMCRKNSYQVQCRIQEYYHKDQSLSKHYLRNSNLYQRWQYRRLLTGAMSLKTYHPFRQRDKKLSQLKEVSRKEK